MSRADDDTQVDYSLLDDERLADAVAEHVLGLQEREDVSGLFWVDEEGLLLEVDVDWPTAGLVIDTLRAEGLLWSIEDYVGFTVAEVAKPYSDESEGDAQHESPIRAILIAALRAKERT